VKDIKGTASLAKKFSLLSWALADKLQTVIAIGALSSASNQETAQGQQNRYLSELTEAKYTR